MHAPRPYSTQAPVSTRSSKPALTRSNVPLRQSSNTYRPSRPIRRPQFRIATPGGHSQPCQLSPSPGQQPNSLPSPAVPHLHPQANRAWPPPSTPTTLAWPGSRNPSLSGPRPGYVSCLRGAPVTLHWGWLSNCLYAWLTILTQTGQAAVRRDANRIPARNGMLR